MLLLHKPRNELSATDFDCYRSFPPELAKTAPVDLFESLSNVTSQSKPNRVDKFLKEN